MPTVPADWLILSQCTIWITNVIQWLRQWPLAEKNKLISSQVRWFTNFFWHSYSFSLEKRPIKQVIVNWLVLGKNGKPPIFVGAFVIVHIWAGFFLSEIQQVAVFGYTDACPYRWHYRGCRLVVPEFGCLLQSTGNTCRPTLTKPSLLRCDTTRWHRPPLDCGVGVISPRRKTSSLCHDYIDIMYLTHTPPYGTAQDDSDWHKR